MFTDSGSVQSPSYDSRVITNADGKRGGVAATGIILAVAVWSFSQYLGIGVLLVCGGVSLQQTLKGVAYVIRQRGEAMARVIEAQGGIDTARLDWALREIDEIREQSRLTDGR